MDSLRAAQEDVDRPLRAEDLLHGRWAILSRGRRATAVAERA